MLGQRFYMGLADSLKANVDASAGGALLSKTFREMPIEIDDSAGLTEVTVQHAQENANKEKEVLKETEVLTRYSAGAVAKLIAKEGKSAILKLPSGEVRLISKNCSATVGQVGNVGVNQKSLGKAGSKRWLGKRPVVRGVVMNPVDHPHGGGEGRARGFSRLWFHCLLFCLVQ
ncbi:PREDICTED: uncharacterized protein LOC109225946 [Nicotiana attenuata]|uniref:uncharacterized protein LOC109225946 n=1 Tax=Nicotiana attenuata TaxID=49451 RepID=UPI00090586FB|nr:PREDICTED: uncharacterized protein LOC109225946 [Nicotiana attenuata]